MSDNRLSCKSQIVYIPTKTAKTSLLEIKIKRGAQHRSFCQVTHKALQSFSVQLDSMMCGFRCTSHVTLKSLEVTRTKRCHKMGGDVLCLNVIITTLSTSHRAYFISHDSNISTRFARNGMWLVTLQITQHAGDEHRVIHRTKSMRKTQQDANGSSTLVLLVLIQVRQSSISHWMILGPSSVG